MTVACADDGENKSKRAESKSELIALDTADATTQTENVGTASDTTFTADLGKESKPFAGGIIMRRQQNSGTAVVVEVDISELTRVLGGWNVLRQNWSSVHWIAFNAAAHRYCDQNIYPGYGSGIGQEVYQPVSYARIVCFKRAKSWHAQLTAPAFDRHGTPCDGHNFGEFYWLFCASAASRHTKNLRDGQGRAPWFVVEHGGGRAVFVQPERTWWFQANVNQAPIGGIDLRIPAAYDPHWYSFRANLAAERFCRSKGALGGQIAELDSAGGFVEMACVF